MALQAAVPQPLHGQLAAQLARCAANGVREASRGQHHVQVDTFLAPLPHAVLEIGRAATEHAVAHDLERLLGLSPATVCNVARKRTTSMFVCGLLGRDSILLRTRAQIKGEGPGAGEKIPAGIGYVFSPSTARYTHTHEPFAS